MTIINTIKTTARNTINTITNTMTSTKNRLYLQVVEYQVEQCDVPLHAVLEPLTVAEWKDMIQATDELDDSWSTL